MKTNKFLITLAAGAVGLVGIAGAGVALADDVPGPGPNAGMMRGGHGPVEGRGPADGTRQYLRHDQMHAAAAQALGISVDELEAQLAAGKTVATIAAERGIDLATVQDAMRAQRPGPGGAGRMGGGGPGAGTGDCPYSDTN